MPQESSSGITKLTPLTLADPSRAHHRRLARHGNRFLQGFFVAAVVLDDAETLLSAADLGPDLAHLSHGLQQKAGTVAEAAAIGIVALVADGPRKLCAR